MMHSQPKMPKAYLIYDINQWIEQVTKDPSAGLKDADRMTVRDLEMLVLAITAAQRDDAGRD